MTTYNNIDEIYQPEQIEPYVQNVWEKNNYFKVTENINKEKYYCLAMLPYPSGNLHMGHVRNYTISDVISRYHRMLGKNVLQPMGWDAFGLPAEEAAIKNNISPKTWTYQNIQKMKKQLKLLGFSYDWSREITTCESSFYHWEQWFFTKLYQSNLVYKKKSSVNWCPTDKTVLANEQIINGCCWRCNTKVILKYISQWFIRTTKYAEELLNDIKYLTQWPDKVKKMQKNWIGRMEIYEISLKILNSTEKIIIQTNIPDEIINTTYISISPFHDFVQKIIKKRKKIKKFIQNICNIMQKKNSINCITTLGINTNQYAIHPLTKALLPIWINNILLINDISDAIFSTPINNKNDFNFATKYQIKKQPKFILYNKKYTCNQYKTKNNTKKILYIDHLNDLKNKQINSTIINKILKKNGIAKLNVKYKLKDWTVSRQRYWGTPIPMLTNKKGKITPIPDNQLPLILSEQKNIVNFQHTKNQNKIHPIYINGKKFFKESDTFDTFMESSWYYIRYISPKFNTGIVDKNASNYWLPIDQYVGGIEHATMHLIYIRFYHKLLRDFGWVKTDEPIKQLLCQGMVLSNAFYYITHDNKKKWIDPKFVQIKKNTIGEKVYIHNITQKKLIHAGMIKMSKSKNNGIEPDIMIKKYGADTVRLFIMFAAPVENSLEWKESGIKGIHRFLQKLWKLIYYHINNIFFQKKIYLKKLTIKQQQIRSLLHKTIAKVSDDIERRKTFNTAISEIMKCVNYIIQQTIENEQDYLLVQEALTIIIKMLYPFVPHFSFFILKNMLNTHTENGEILWPKFDPNAIITQFKTKIIIQINGKIRCRISTSSSLSKEQIVNLAKLEPSIIKYTNHAKIKKIIYIPNKILNLVLY
ncbi:leucine--tRNA ligase [Buchnera aphidicola (Formosaphis micheliae)]|uniref:leucine--tRNA ligase n=1 Tax=Buchnera aphidicola TaxID=9 RepID=UPI0031CCC3AB